MAESANADGSDNPLVRQLESRDHLSDEERQVLIGSVALTRDIAPHRDLAREGDEPGESNILLEGFAYRYRLLADGRRQISLFHVPGDFIDLHGFLLKRLDHAIAAAGPCRVGVVPDHRELPASHAPPVAEHGRGRRHPPRMARRHGAALGPGQHGASLL